MKMAIPGLCIQEFSVADCNQKRERMWPACNTMQHVHATRKKISGRTSSIFQTLTPSVYLRERVRCITRCITSAISKGTYDYNATGPGFSKPL